MGAQLAPIVSDMSDHGSFERTGGRHDEIPPQIVEDEPGGAVEQAHGPDAVGDEDGGELAEERFEDASPGGPPDGVQGFSGGTDALVGEEMWGAEDGAVGVVGEPDEEGEGVAEEGKAGLGCEGGVCAPFFLGEGCAEERAEEDVEDIVGEADEEGNVGTVESAGRYGEGGFDGARGHGEGYGADVEECATGVLWCQTLSNKFASQHGKYRKR